MDANKNRSSKSSFNASSSRGPGFCQQLWLSVMILTAKPLFFEGGRAASRAPTGRGTMRAGHRHNHGTAGQRSQPAPTPDFQSATRTISVHHPVRRPVSTPWRLYRDHTEFAEILHPNLCHMAASSMRYGRPDSKGVRLRPLPTLSALRSPKLPDRRHWAPLCWVIPSRARPLVRPKGLGSFVDKTNPSHLRRGHSIFSHPSYHSHLAQSQPCRI